ncbi:hypothetical protein [Methanoculleus sp. UBA312]|jgi:hypothetical protein|uniref:hypothetical protein n=1 Tax=Methanoculleus sp. UBA312 TaxID=1915499 RepID=UPI0031BADA86
MARYDGDELTPQVRTIDGEVYRQFHLTLLALDVVMPPKKTETAFKNAGIRFRGQNGAYWVHIQDWSAAFEAIDQAIDQARRVVREPTPGESDLAESLLRSGVSPRQIADLRQADDLRCALCGRVLEIVDEDEETTWIACPICSTSSPDAEAHSSARLDHPIDAAL